MPLLKIFYTLIVILIFIAIITKIDADINFLHSVVATLLANVFVTSFLALPIVLLMHIWSK